MTSPFSCRAREVTCHYGHVNRFYYLLTYLLTYLQHAGLVLAVGQRGSPYGQAVACRVSTGHTSGRAMRQQTDKVNR